MTPLEKEKFNQVGELIQKARDLFQNNSDTLSDFVYIRDEMETNEVELATKTWEQISNTLFEVSKEYNILKEHFEEIEDNE